MIVQPFVHEALLYRHRDEFLAGTVPFIEAGLARDEPVLVASLPSNVDLLRQALPAAAAARVPMLDMSRAGRNPGRIIPSVLLAFAGAHPGRPVRIIGEPIWPGRSPLEYPACVQHEALINAAFAGREAIILCPYDATGLDQQAIADAERTHPVLRTARGEVPSARYGDPVATAGNCNLPLPPPPATAVTSQVDLGGLAGLRQRIVAQAEAAGLPPERVMDAVIAVNELASNTLDHHATPGTVTSWQEDGYLVCQVTDRGHIADPLVGRIPAPPEAVSGRGLLVVNQICDLVRVHTEPGGTTIRIHLGADPIDLAVVAFDLSTAGSP